MRIHIDRSVCSGHGRCFSLSPEVFAYDDEGFGVPKSEVIAPQLEAAARRAVGACPEQAIEFDED